MMSLLYRLTNYIRPQPKDDSEQHTTDVGEAVEHSQYDDVSSIDTQLATYIDDGYNPQD